MTRSRLWLPAAVCLIVYIALVTARYEGWQAKAVPLGTPYLHDCTAAGTGFHCSSDTSTALKAVTAPIRLKAKHDYVVTLSGHAPQTDPVKVYVDFYGGKDYDAPAQKGTVMLRDGPARTFVLRWSSDMPPEQASFRLSNADAPDFTFESVHITRLSSGLVRVATIVLAIGLLLGLYALWRDRARLLAFRLPKPAWRRMQAGSLRALFLVFTSVAVLLLIRVSVMGAPMVFGDEMSYALLSASLGDPTVYSHNMLVVPLPNQVFFDLYHVATLCGDSMLGVARAMNALLFASAAFPIFGLCRRYLPEKRALALTLFILLMPNSAYTSFFMPESFYFPVFYCVTWAFVVFLDSQGRNVHAALAGFALAVLSLIKPHGLTILLACNLTLLVAVCAWRGERRRIAQGWGVLLLVFVVARGVLGISAAPSVDEPWTQRIFGGMYASMLSNTLHFAWDAQALDRLRLATIDNLGSLLLLFAPVLVVSIGWMTRRRSGAAIAQDTTLDRLHLFTFVALGCLLFGTIKFTAAIAGVDTNQTPDLIHQRYYDFIFGLLLLGAAASLQAMPPRGWQLRKQLLLWWLPFIGIVFWYLTHELTELHPSWVHHPTLVGLWAWRANGIMYVAWVLAVSLAIVPIAPRFALRVYTVCLALACAGGFFLIWHYGARSQTPDEADRASLAVKSLYDPVRLEHGLVVSESLWPLFRTTFHLRNNATVQSLPEGSMLDAARTAGAEWILTYGHYELPDEWKPRSQVSSEATLYERVTK
jgi:phosphoglycerol transferase